MGELRRHTLEELDRCFGERGFTRTSDSFYGDRYDRPTPDGRQSVLIASHNRSKILVLDSATASVRLDAVELEVFRFELKDGLVREHDALWRGTVGECLDRFDLLKTLTGRYAIANPDKCESIARRYATEMLGLAEQFWRGVETPEAILAKLKTAPIRARNDVYPALRAIVLTKITGGAAAARQLTDLLLSQSTGDPKLQISQWATRAFIEWGALDR